MRTWTATLLALGIILSILSVARGAQRTPAAGAGWSERYQPTKLEWLALRLEAEHGDMTMDPVNLSFQALSPDELSIHVQTRESPDGRNVQGYAELVFLSIQKIARDMGLEPPIVSVGITSFRGNRPGGHRQLRCRVPVEGPNEKTGRFFMSNLCR
jgi:hypothetical protein